MTEQSRAVRDVAIPGASLSVLAEGRESGDVHATVSPSRSLPPASNTKLVTAGVALDTLGPDFTFETRLAAREETDDGVLDGDLLLVGTGAPDLEQDDLETLAAAVGNRITRIAGDLVVDGSMFTDGHLAPGWTWGDQRYYYGARSSALALDRNQVTVCISVENSPDGEVEPTVTVTPKTAAVEVDCDLSVSQDAAIDDIEVYADHESGTVTVRGALPPEADTVEESVPIRQPECHCAGALVAALADAGVSLDGEIRLEEGSEPNDDAETLASVTSAPVRDLVREMNLPSDNFIAEQLARRVAHEVTGEGSWAHWETLVQDHFEALGSENVRIRDGSGLSRYNTIPASALLAHLRWVDEQPWAEAFFDSLPTPGEGTLSSRLSGVTVAAKTGTITGTSALTGVVRRDADEDVFFSLLHGGLTRDRGDEAREKQDAFVEWLASETDA